MKGGMKTREPKTGRAEGKRTFYVRFDPVREREVEAKRRELGLSSINDLFVRLWDESGKTLTRDGAGQGGAVAELLSRLTPATRDLVFGEIEATKNHHRKES